MSNYYSPTSAYRSKFDETKLFATGDEARAFDCRWAAKKVAEQDDGSLGKALREGDAVLWLAMRFLVDEMPATLDEARA